VSKILNYSHNSETKDSKKAHIYPGRKTISIKEWSMGEKWSNDFLFPALINDSENSCPLLICKMV